jgi:ABC-type Mn2+/Zn2+ transport system permease subunit
MPMAARETKKSLVKAFIYAMVCDALCIIAGVIGYLATLHLIWIFIGVLGGLGFILPALIRLKRASREQG